MTRSLLRILLAALMFCGVLDFSTGVMAQSVATDKADRKNQVSSHSDLLHNMAEEPRSPVGSSFCSSLPSHRVASHRTVRLLPSNGGKPSNKSGKWATVSLSKLQNYLPTCICHFLSGARMGFASPRHYYVIALRRILC
ncbi:MAG: hypothetical protein IKZ61_07020 [Prevotella sp.]|nr:hypothetical protein [Prevotella sp.]